MSSPNRRRPSAAVYRRRRIVVFGSILLILAAVALLILQPWNAAAEKDPAPTKTTASPTPTAIVPSVEQTPGEGGGSGEQPAPPAEEAPVEAPPEEAPVEETPVAEAPVAPAEPVTCGPLDVRVDAVTDKTEYGSEDLPQLSLSLTNLSGVDCTLDVGTAVQSFTVTSGSDTWWRSTDCQANPTNQLATLPAGQTVTSQAPLVWDRTRSAVETCGDETRPRASGGGASYHLTVSLGGIESRGTAQFMLY